MIYAWLLSFSVMLLLLTSMVKFDQPLFALWIIVEKMPESLSKKRKLAEHLKCGLYDVVCVHNG